MAEDDVKSAERALDTLVSAEDVDSVLRRRIRSAEAALESKVKPHHVHVSVRMFHFCFINKF